MFYYESGQTAEFFQEKNHAYVPTFVDPTAADNSSIRNSCQINVTSSPLTWNLAQRACYYDLFMTNDINFAQTSLMAGAELLSILQNQRNPPSFQSSLPLAMNLTVGAQVYLNMSASSEYPSHIVGLVELHRPENATFDQHTGIFQWTAIKGEHYVSIEAHDRTFNLTSKHDIVFNVTTGKTIFAPGNSSINQINEVSITILIFGLIAATLFSIQDT